MAEQPLEIFVLVIEHKYGADINAYLTEEGALEKVDQYVEECWPFELRDKRRPTDRAQARELYFDAVDGECYRLEHCVVGD